MADTDKDGVDSGNLGGSFTNQWVKAPQVQNFKLIGAPDVQQTVIDYMLQIIRTRHEVLTIVNLDVIQVASDNSLNQDDHNLIVDNVPTWYSLTINRAPHIIATNINFASPVFDSKLDPSIASMYMTSKITSLRAFTSNIRSGLAMSRNYAEGIVMEFQSGMIRHDLTTMFVIGFMQMVNLFAMNVNGWVPILTPVPAGAIVTVNTNCAQAVLEQNVNDTLNAINSGRICLFAREINPLMWQVILALATGLPYYTRGPNDMQIPIMSTFVSPGIRFMIYSDQPVVVPVAHVITAEEFKHGLLAISVALDAQTCFVKGFTRASTMWCGVIDDQWSHPPNVPNRVVQQQFFNSGFETQSIDLPRPSCSNFLWNILQLTNHPLCQHHGAFFKNEFNSLIIATLDECLRISGGISQLYSLGCSTMFHTWNISGQCLNVVSTPLAAVTSSVYNNLQVLFRPPTADTFNVLSQVACSFAGQFSRCTISPHSFQSRSFCSNVNGIGNAHIDRLWSELWGRTIPYIGDPLCISTLLNAWPSTFGYAAPTMTADLRTAIISSGALAENHLDISRLDNTYENVMKSGSPFTYVPFGNILLNFIHQHWRFPNALPVSFHHLAKAQDMSTTVLPQWHQAGLQPTYEPVLFRFEVGGLPTFGWFSQQMLLPYIRRNHILPNEWAQITMGSNVNSNRAGLILMFAGPSQLIKNAEADLLSLFDGISRPLIIDHNVPGNPEN